MITALIIAGSLVGAALVMWALWKSTSIEIDDLESNDPERVEHALDHW